MNTNRFISSKDTFDSKPLQDVAFGGAIIAAIAYGVIVWLAQWVIGLFV